eukprot:15475958-Alexandrium_andersonii.AAC.1
MQGNHDAVRASVCISVCVCACVHVSTSVSVSVLVSVSVSCACVLWYAWVGILECPVYVEPGLSACVLGRAWWMCHSECS